MSGLHLIDYLESFEGSAGRGLYIYGSVGRGKSYSAAALANAVSYTHLDVYKRQVVLGLVRPAHWALLDCRRAHLLSLTSAD